MKILFVDDDEVTLFLYRKLVKSTTGHEVNYAKNGAEALDWLHSSNIPYHLIFLDVNMPVMDGLTFIREYQNLPQELQKARIYLMTGGVLPESLQDKLELNQVEEQLEKPLKEAVFQRILTGKSA